MIRTSNQQPSFLPPAPELGFHIKLFDALITDPRCLDAMHDTGSALVLYGSPPPSWQFLAVVAALAMYEEAYRQRDDDDDEDRLRSQRTSTDEKRQDEQHCFRVDPVMRELLEEEVRDEIRQLELENDALFIALEETETLLEVALVKHRQTRRKYDRSLGEIGSLQDEVVELTSKLSETSWELAATQSDLEDMQMTYRHQLEDRERVLSETRRERDENETQSQRRERRLQRRIEDYEATLAAKDLKIMNIVQDRDQIRRKMKAMLAEDGIHPTLQQNVMERVKDVRLNATLPPNRWVNGINRMRGRPLRIGDASMQ